MAWVALLAAALIVVSPVTQIVSKLLVDPIAHATSSGAAIVTALFLAASALAMRRSDSESGAGCERLAALLLVGALLLGNAVNLAGHFVILKAALSSLLAPLAPRLALDVGQGLGAMLPLWITFTCLLSLIAAVGAYLWMLPRVAARFDSPPWAAVLFGVAVLNAAKAIIDGGLLSYRSVPALLVVAMFVWPASREQWRRRALPWSVGSLALLATYVAIWQRLAPADSHEALQAFVEFLALLALLAALAFRNFPARRVALAGLSTIVAMAYASSFVLGSGLLLQPLGAGYVAVVVDLPTLAAHTEPAAGRLPIDVYRQWGDDPLKPRHVFIMRRRPGEQPLPLSFAVIAQARGHAAR